MPGKRKIEAADQGSETRDTGVEPPLDGLSDRGRDSLAAALRANRAVTDGLEAVGKEMVDYAQASLETAALAAKALLRVRTFADLIRVNADFAKASLEQFALRSARLSEVGAKLAEDTLAATEASGASAISQSKSRAA